MARNTSNKRKHAITGICNVVFVSKIRILILALLISIPLIAIFTNQAAGHRRTTSATLDYILSAAYNRRAKIVTPLYTSLLPYIQGYEQVLNDVNLLIDSIGLGAFLAFLSRLNYAPSDVPAYINPEKAWSDTASLELMLRLYYAPFFYFGGDEVFIPLFDSIHSTLQTREYWATGPYGTFNALLHDKLFQVIKDNHFYIGRQMLGMATDRVPSHFQTPVSADFYISMTDFERTANGFRCIVFDMYIREIPGHSLDDIFQLALTDEGELTYIIVLYTTEGSIEPLKSLPVIFEDNEHGAILFIRHRSAVRPAIDYPTLEWISGIPVVSISTMGHYPHDHSASIFTEFAYQLRSEPVVIIDVRSNTGGSNLLPIHFFYNLIGEQLSSTSITLHSWDTYEYLGYVTPQFTSRFTGRRVSLPVKVIGPYHVAISYTPHRIVQNDNLIIILTDRHTASAGEHLAELALGMGNALIIGQNTAGIARTMQGNTFYMPNSGLSFSFSNGLTFFPDGVNAEGIGITPDLWATGDALETALLFLQSQGVVR